MSDDNRIRSICPNCGKSLSLPNNAAGRRARCPKCGNAFVVADSIELAAGESHSREMAGVGSERGHAAAGRSRSASASEQSSFADDDPFAALAGGTALERPASAPMARPEPILRSAPAAEAREPRQRFAWGALIGTTIVFMLKRSWVGRLCLVAVVFGCVFVYMGYREAQLRGESKAEPQTLTCEQLARSGPGDNRHINLTDFALLPEFVYQEDMGSWKGAWVPAVPRKVMEDAIAALPPDDRNWSARQSKLKTGPSLNMAAFDFKVVVAFPQADSAEYIGRMAKNHQVQGLVINGIMPGFDSDRRRLLQESYPRVHVDDCMILVAGRTPASASAVQSYFFGGAALIAAGFGIAGWICARSATA